MDATNAQTCRTCLAENAANLGLNCIMQNCPSSRTYKEILQELTQIQIMDELEFQMPQNICSSCYKQLQIAYNFIRKSQECNQKLLEMFSKHVQADDGMEKVEYVIVKQEDDEQFLMDMVQDIRNEPVQMSIVKEEKILENEQMEEASCSNINKVVEDYDENSKSLTENSSHMFSDNPCDDDDDEYIPDKDDEEYIPDKEFTKPNELDKRLKITTPKQFQKLLELLQENPSLINTFNTKIDKENSRKKWKKITNELNSLGPPIRDEKGWQKVWADYKCHIKKKMVRGHVFTPLQAAVSHLLRSNHPANTCNVQNKKADDVSKKSKVNDIAAPAATAPPPPDNTTTINKENMEPKSQVFAKKRNNMTAFDKHELLAEQLQVQTDLYKEVRHFLIAIEKWNQKSFQLNEEKLKLYKQDLIKKQENRAALLELRKEEIELKKKILELKEYKHIIDENM